MKIIRRDIEGEAEKLVWAGLGPNEAADKAAALNRKFGDRFIYEVVDDDYELRGE